MQRSHLRRPGNFLELGRTGGAAGNSADARIAEDVAEGFLRQRAAFRAQSVDQGRDSLGFVFTLFLADILQCLLLFGAFYKEASGQHGSRDNAHILCRGSRHDFFESQLRGRVVVVVKEQGVEFAGGSQPGQQRNGAAGYANYVAQALFLRRAQPLQGTPRLGDAFPACEVDLMDLGAKEFGQAEPLEAALQAP